MTKRLNPKEIEGIGCVCCERLDSEGWSDWSWDGGWYCDECKTACNGDEDARMVDEPRRVLVAQEAERCRDICAVLVDPQPTNVKFNLGYDRLLLAAQQAAEGRGT